MKFISRIPVPLLLAFGAVLLLLPWFRFCFDYVDIGWNATKAWMMIEHPESAFWEFSWLSSMVGGLFIKATGCSIFWLRIGAIMIAALTVLSAYAVLRLYYAPKESGLALIPIFLLYISGHAQFIPTYYEIPLLFSLPAIWFHLKSCMVTERREIVLLSLGSGFFFALLAQSRLPSASFGLVYAATALIEYRSAGGMKNVSLRLAATFSGILLGTGLIALLLFLSGDLGFLLQGLRDTWLGAFASNGNDNIHHPFRLLHDTAIRYGKVACMGGIALGGAFFWQRLLPGREPTLREPFSLICFGIVAVVVALCLYHGLGGFPVPFGIMLALLYLVLKNREGKIGREKLLLYTVALFQMVFLNVGASNPSAWSFKFTAWILLPVVFIESAHLRSPHFSIPLLRWTLLLSITALMIVSRIFNDHPIYRMTTPFRTAVLHPLCGTKETVEEFEELTAQLRMAGLHPGDTALCYVDIPMIHFATQTIPALRNAWISDHALVWPSCAEIRERIQEQKKENKLPKIVVRAFTDWAPQTPKTRYLDSVWGACRYDTVWRSSRFILLRRPG